MNEPHFVDTYEDTHGITRIFIWFIAVILAALAAGIVIVLLTEDFIRAASIGITLPFVLAATLLVRRQRFELAAAFLALVLMSLCTVVATQGLGIHSISNIGFAAILIVASMVTRRSTMVLLTLFAVACLAWLVFGELAGWYRPDPLEHSVAGDFFTASLTIVASSFMLRLMSKALFQSHQRLRESERRWQFALEGNGDGVWDWNIKTGRVLRSRQWKAMLGYETHEIGESPAELFGHLHPEDRARVTAEFDRFCAGRDPVIESEFRARCRDGSSRWILCRGQVMERADDGGPLRCIGTHSDITRRKEAEEGLRQAQKLEFVGRLTGGVAHDFNNLLTVIAGNAELAQLQLPEASPVRELIGEVLSAAKSAADLIQQLMAFSRKQVVTPRVVRPGELLAGMRRILSRLIGEDVALEVSAARDLADVRIDPIQLEQVVVNLAVNARDAMPEGGRLLISAGNVEVGPGNPRAPAGRYVELLVQDTGAGISEEVKRHLFEPFFTTKPAGRGTGLGLATVHSIVHQNGGEINVASAEGQGTTISILLPALDPGTAPTGENTDTGVEPRGSETLLVVEDNDTVRRVAHAQLEELGYAVFSFPGGEAALAWAAGFPGRIHLLVTDVVMPVMNGRVLAKRLALERPGIRVLFLSGYADDVVAQHEVLEAGASFLAKPFSRHDLALKIRDTLVPG